MCIQPAAASLNPSRDRFPTLRGADTERARAQSDQEVNYCALKASHTARRLPAGLADAGGSPLVVCSHLTVSVSRPRRRRRRSAAMCAIIYGCDVFRHPYYNIRPRVDKNGSYIYDSVSWQRSTCPHRFRSLLWLHFSNLFDRNFLKVPYDTFLCLLFFIQWSSPARLTTKKTR